MRIAHVTATFPPYQGGTGNVCFYNARELARRGHEVHVFTAALPGTDRREVREGIVVHRLRPLVRAGNAPVLPGLLWALRGFDVIHLHCPFIFGGELTSLAAGLHKTPLVVTYHNDLIGSGTWRDVIFHLATWSCRHGVLYRADRVLFVSQGHAATSNQSTVYWNRREQSAILPNGVDTGVFSPQGDRSQVRRALRLSIDSRIIGFVGALDMAHHYKGLDVLLSALATPRLAGALLLVVGDGDLKDYYRQQANDLGILDRVIFYGPAGHEDLPSLYRACDVVAVPSLVAESFGLVVVEALACGVPVVASDGPGVRSVLSDGEDGFLVRAGDVTDLTDRLGILLNDPEALRQMGERGRAKVEAQYSWKQSGARLEAIYRQVSDSFGGTAPSTLRGHP